MTTGKTTALTIWTFGIEGMSMLFNTLSKLVIAFLPKSKCLLISWLQSPCTMILVLEKWKSITVSTLPHSVSHRVIGLDATIFSSVSQLCLTLQPHGLQHTRLPCPSPTPRVCSNMSPLTLMPFNHLILCCPLLFQSSIFPSISAFLMSQFFTSGGQSIGASASAWVLWLNIQDWFPLGFTAWISLKFKGLSSDFNTTIQKHQLFGIQLS